jgi:hypothetical protein
MVEAARGPDAAADRSTMQSSAETALTRRWNNPPTTATTSDNAGKVHLAWVAVAPEQLKAVPSVVEFGPRLSALLESEDQQER